MPENCCPACKAITKHNAKRSVGLESILSKFQLSRVWRLVIHPSKNSHEITLVGRFLSRDNSKKYDTPHYIYGNTKIKKKKPA